MKKYWWGSDVPVRTRLTRPTVTPTGNGTPLVRADLSTIKFSLFRLYKSKWTIVLDASDVPQSDISLTIADVVYDTLQGWRKDTIGYNFEHIIDEVLLTPIAQYRATYDITTTDGISQVYAREFLVDHAFDAGVQPGSSTIFVSGADGDDGDDGAGYLATSTTSVSIGTGSKSFTTQSGLAYTAGARVRASSAADTSNWMEGLVTAYSGTTLVASMTLTNGSGTLADWNINLAGERGQTGDTGATGGPGTAGSTGATGPGYRATSTSSVASGTGIQTFITQTGLAYSSGARVRVTNTADLDSFMEGVVTIYTSNILVIDVDLVTSSGTISSWNINLAGERGQTGLQGEQGVQGIQGIQGIQGVPGAPGSGGGSGYVYDVTSDTYGAVGDGVTDDTASVQSCVDAAALTGTPQTIWFPDGVYLCQDPDEDPHTGSSDGPIRIPIGAQLTLRGSGGAKILLGPNGCSKGLIRCFGRACVIEGLEIDLNGLVPVTTTNTLGSPISPAKNNVAIEVNASGGGTADVDGCDCEVRNNYIHGSRYLLEYSTGTIAYDHTGNGSGERVVILTGGTWPAAANFVADQTVIKIPYDAGDATVGTWYPVSGRISDSVIQLESGTGNNPGSDVASSTAYMFNAEPYKTGGQDGIQVLNGNRCRVHHNIIEDVGWSAIRTNGDGNKVYDNILKDFRGNGIRLADGDYCEVTGNRIRSVHCSGRSCLLADAGSSSDGDVLVADPAALTNNDVRIKDLVIRDNYSYCNSNGNFEGAGSAIKLGAVRHCVVDGGVYYAGTDTNNTAIRIEDCIRKVTFQNLRCVGPFQQTNNAMTAAVTATVSRAAGTYAGKLQLTIASHGQVLGKSVWLVNCPVAKWDDQEFIVIEVVDSNNIVVGRVTDDEGTVTPEPYAAGSITGTVAHAGVHELVMKNVMVERGTHNENNFVRFVSSPWVDIEGCVFEQVGPRTTGTVKETGLLFDYASDAYIKRLRIVRNEFRFDTTALCRAIRSQNGAGVGASDETAGGTAPTFITAGKFVCYGNRLENRSTGTVELVQRYEDGDSILTYADRLIIFSTDGESPNRFISAAAPTGAFVAWNQGDTIRNSGPSSGGTPGWVCTTAGTSGAVLRAMSPLQYTTFFSTANGTAVANFDANEEVSATPTTGVGSLQFGGNRALTVGEWFDLTASGSYSTTVTPTLNFGVSLGMSQIGNGASGSPVGTAAETGRTSLADATAFTTGSSVSNLRWRLELKGVVKVVATSGTVQVTGRIAYETATDTWVEKWIEPADVTVNTSATTHNRKLDVWAAWGTKSASNTFTCKQFSSVTR